MNESLELLRRFQLRWEIEDLEEKNKKLRAKNKQLKQRIKELEKQS